MVRRANAGFIVSSARGSIIVVGLLEVVVAVEVLAVDRMISIAIKMEDCVPVSSRNTVDQYLDRRHNGGVMYSSGARIKAQTTHTFLIKRLLQKTRAARTVQRLQLSHALEANGEQTRLHTTTG